MTDRRPLEGVRVVVTRAAAQSGPLTEGLEALGATSVNVPLIEIVDPVDGAAVDRAMRAADEFDWVVVTSPNGAERLAAGGGLRSARRVAVVGSGTGAAVERLGRVPDLVPDRAVAEGLLDVFPAPPGGGGRVLLFQAEAARPVLGAGLAARGWDVDPVVAYRTVSVPLEGTVREAVASADAITFTSSSTVTSFLAAGGAAVCPLVVVCIGPITAATARDGGLPVAAVADPHTIDGLIQAVVDCC